MRLFNTLVNWFYRSTNSLVVSILSYGFSFVVYKRRGNKVVFEYVNFVEADNKNGVDFVVLSAQLKFLVKEYYLRRGECFVLLSVAFYHNFPQKIPDQLGRNEWKQAMRYQVRELVDWEIEEFVFDAYQPGEQEGGNVYAVVAERALLSKLAEVVGECNLVLTGVGIQDFAMASLASLREDFGYLGLLAIEDEGCLLEIVREGVVYFARIFFVDWSKELVGLVEEIKRSLAFGQGTINIERVGELLVLPTNKIKDKQVKELEQLLEIPVAFYDFKVSDRFQSLFEVEENFDYRSNWLAIGGLCKQMLERGGTYESAD